MSDTKQPPAKKATATQASIQDSITQAADQLTEAFNNKKTANASLKDLKKALKEALQDLPEYQELQSREKKIKDARKDLTEELKEIKKSKEQLALETDEQRELDDFVDDQEEKFGKVKDRVIGKLSRELADAGIIAEIAYKSGQLMLIVARS